MGALSNDIYGDPLSFWISGIFYYICENLIGKTFNRKSRLSSFVVYFVTLIKNPGLFSLLKPIPFIALLVVNPATIALLLLSPGFFGPTIWVVHNLKSDLLLVLGPKWFWTVCAMSMQADSRYSSFFGFFTTPSILFLTMLFNIPFPFAWVSLRSPFY